MKKIVVALGGNALQEAGGENTAKAQLAAAEKAAEHIAGIIAQGHTVAIVHGNGPQVGRLVVQNEYAASVTPAMPFDVCGAMSQGMIGYHIQQALAKVLAKQGINKQVASLLTQVVVDENDPMFENPTKPIGLFYTEDEAKAIALEKGYIMKEDSGRGWRRVVASPRPVEINELAAIKNLIEGGFVVISVGGGGVPVIKSSDGQLTGVAAVIDKDLAGEKLAEDIDADLLLILTAVEKVSLNFGKPDQMDLDTLSVEDAGKYIAQGHFAPGSMLPKVEAAVKFAASGAGRKAIITSLDKAAAALEGRAGTVVGG